MRLWLHCLARLRVLFVFVRRFSLSLLKHCLYLSKKDETKEYDSVLVAIGRSPLTENIGLDNVNIVTENGFINVDLETFQTSEENIFALGDIVANTPQLAHAAFAEAAAPLAFPRRFPSGHSRKQDKCSGCGQQIEAVVRPWFN